MEEVEDEVVRVDRPVINWVGEEAFCLLLRGLPRLDLSTIC